MQGLPAAQFYTFAEVDNDFSFVTKYGIRTRSDDQPTLVTSGKNNELDNEKTLENDFPYLHPTDVKPMSL